MKYFKLVFGGMLIVTALTIAGQINQSYNIRLILDGEITTMFWIVQITFIIIPLVPGIFLVRSGMRRK